MTGDHVFILFFMGFVSFLAWTIHKIISSGNPPPPNVDKAVQILKEAQDEIQRKTLDDLIIDNIKQYGEGGSDNKIK